ncbi:mechanosensitive ion channel family protein [Catalinimonas alkaloidigena]|uniref:mechanosensitive ion channel family protein n=1 Tax=Catalinimonas alkaloidigena TaxID=1075417 RepID=UPI001C40A437|nr:mechanosensitive ion channel family protein [Catalinimonas alkaloidigena]
MRSLLIPLYRQHNSLFACLFFFLPLGAGYAQVGLSGDSAVSAPDSVSAQTRVEKLSEGSDAITEYNEAYYVLKKLNAGLPAPPQRPNLQSPQAALEHFVRAGRARDFDEAARVLNLNLVPQGEQAAKARILATNFYYVLDKQIGFDWESLPDRPDGASTEPSMPNDPLVGMPRRSIRIGALDLDGRDVAIRLQRVKVKEASPVWVFSPQTVENIPALFYRYGPGPIDRMMPTWARAKFMGRTSLWVWLAFLVAIGLVSLLAWGVRKITKRQFARADSYWTWGIGDRVATPFALFISILLLFILAKLVLSLPAGVDMTLLVLLITSFLWLAMRAIEYFTESVARDTRQGDIKELAGEDGADQQQWLTYLSVGRRVLLFIVFLLGLGIIFSQFRALQTFGLSLMASAGAATVILGIAAQPLLGNIVASIQIALTKPVRIGDSVLYEDNWGYVEEITYTYILIKTWDKRRVVVPLRYFISKPFENWTMRNSHLIKPIYLHADYTLDVDQIRHKFETLLQESDLWDERIPPVVQVTSVEDETMEVRALCSAKDAASAWDLHCELREKLVAYVRDLNEGRHLPRRRIVVTEDVRTRVIHPNGQKVGKEAG